jgi:hypothetical protein
MVDSERLDLVEVRLRYHVPRWESAWVVAVVIQKMRHADR